MGSDDGLYGLEMTLSGCILSYLDNWWFLFKGMCVISRCIYIAKGSYGGHGNGVGYGRCWVCW